MPKRIITYPLMVLLLMSCSVRSLKEVEPDRTSDGLSGFLYMEEVYAFARNKFSAGKFDESIKWYERLDEDFPANPYRSESLFIRGYIYNSFKDDKIKAAAYFNEIIEKYPGSEFYNSAIFELEHINDPDFMPQFEK